MLLFGTHGWPTEPDDDPPSAVVRSRLLPFSVSTQIGSRNGMLAGASAVRLGRIVLANPDGALDELSRTTFTDGRRVRLMVAPVTVDRWSRRRPPPLRRFGTVVEAVARQWTAEDRNPSLELTSILSRLDVPFQAVRYGGSGGMDGSAELAGVPKPLGYGWCRNVLFQMLDPAQVLLQGSDGPSRSIAALRDGGVLLQRQQSCASYEALAAAQPDPGYYAEWLGQTAVKLGAAPQGRVTGDIEAGDGRRAKAVFSDGSRFSDGSGFVSLTRGEYVETTAAVTARILRERGGLAVREVDQTSFAMLDRAVPGRIGWWQAAGGSATVLDVVDRIVAGAAAWLGDDAVGRVQIGRVGPRPSGAEVRLGPGQIKSLRAVTPPWGAPPAAIRVSYAPSWTVQTEAELFDGAAPADRQAATTARRWVGLTDALVAQAYPSSRPFEVESLFDARDDAAAVAQHLRDTYPLGCGSYEAATGLLGARLRCGQPIHLTFAAPGFTAGRFATVTGVSISTQGRDCRVTVLG